MWSSIIERIHSSPSKFSVISTGAGGSSIAALMSVAGCSRTLINAQVPYSTKVTRAILDHNPAHFVCRDVGRQLAQHAFAESCSLGDNSIDVNHLFGIGATAAIATDRTRQGRDVVFVCSWSQSKVVDYVCELSKTLSRAQQEQIVSAVIIKAMADSANVSSAEMELPSEIVVEEFNAIPRPVASLLSGEAKCALYNQHGEARLAVAPFTSENYSLDDTIYLLYPGSFKPLHWGHTELARVAGKVIQRERPEKKNVVVTYEISASIVGKKDVCEEDFTERIEQFTSQHRRVAITTARLFVEKAQMFPNHGLIVGIDTARRVLDPQYYDNSEEKMIAAMNAIESYGCYFIVGGRKHGETWDDLSCLDVPAVVQGMFKGINPSDFRVDISSTEIRARAMSGAP